MKPSHVINLIALCATAAILAGCASTNTTTETSTSAIGLQKPDNVFVYTYAVSPDEVKLDSGISADILRARSGQSRTQEELALGRQVSDDLANELVKEITALGLPANRAVGEPPSTGVTLTIRGQFVSIDEGNRTERVVIGLGLGRTVVKTSTQVYLVRNGRKSLVKSFETDAMSGRKPGAAETMGAGAIAGHVVESAVVTGVTSGVSEAHGATVGADASRSAKNIAAQLKQFFIDQGWIMP